MKQKTLAQIFGFVPSPVCLYVNSVLNQLLLALENMQNILVTWTCVIQMKEYSLLVAKREPLLKNTFGFVDGLNLPIRESSDLETQNAYYNGWLSGCFVSNVFVFSPTGFIIYAAINKPGSGHDSQVARSLYDKLRYDTPHEFNILADSAFAYSDDLSKHILAVMKDSAMDRLTNCDEDRTKLIINKAVFSQRQAAEWGMGTIQRTFGRLKSLLPLNNRKRLTLLKGLITQKFCYIILEPKM
ncbi:hypothetical protein HDV02_003828 [Globomyces sp. JEL0801]|nr:hypothetical protein HDV02_003828 [Globomyces sp. JEL0801]